MGVARGLSILSRADTLSQTIVTWIAVEQHTPVVKVCRDYLSKHPHVEEELMRASQPAPTFLLVP